MENTDSERSRACPIWKPEEAGISRVLRTQNLSWCRSPCRYFELPNWVWCKN